MKDLLIFAFLSLTQIVCQKGLYFFFHFDFVKSFLSFDLPKFMQDFCVLSLPYFNDWMKSLKNLTHNALFAVNKQATAKHF